MQTFSSTNSYFPSMILFKVFHPPNAMPFLSSPPSFLPTHASFPGTALPSEHVQIPYNLLCHPSCLSASEMLQSCPKVTKPTSSDALTPSQPIQDPKHSYLPTLQHILSASRHNSLLAQCLRAASLPLSSIVLQALLQVRQATIYCKHMVPRQSTYHQ